MPVETNKLVKGAGSNPQKKRKQYDSDALDEDSGEETNVKAQKSTKPKARKKHKVDPESSEDGGQEIVGIVVKAPTTGLVPPGQISKNTLTFLTHLKDPACNDREWFHLHEPVYRVAEKEWKDFIQALTDDLIQVDPQLPHLPPKDVIHRIYRDIRFSNDKTPYKRGLSASFSRSGRKGIFAGYHIAVKPGNESIIAAGLWCPGRAELANIRTNLQRNSERFRQVISAPNFVEFFGKAKPHPKGQRQNIFGHEDELKIAPKGIQKDHKDIDILKCRSFAVAHVFMDDEVLDPEFRKLVASVSRVLQPFVHMFECFSVYLESIFLIIDKRLNELLTVGGGGGGGDEM